MHPNDTTLYPCDHCGTLFKPREARNRFCCRACYREGAAKSAFERMQRYIDKSGGDDACWNWIGKSVHEWGYGLTSEARTGRSLYAHRVMYESLVGPVPNGISTTAPVATIRVAAILVISSLAPTTTTWQTCGQRADPSLALTDGTPS
jgi:hypothetical protein